MTIQERLSRGRTLAIIISTEGRGTLLEYSLSEGEKIAHIPQSGAQKAAQAAGINKLSYEGKNFFSLLETGSYELYEKYVSYDTYSSKRVEGDIKYKDELTGAHGEELGIRYAETKYTWYKKLYRQTKKACLIIGPSKELEAKLSLFKKGWPIDTIFLKWINETSGANLEGRGWVPCYGYEEVHIKESYNGNSTVWFGRENNMPFTENELCRDWHGEKKADSSYDWIAKEVNLYQGEGSKPTPKE